MATLYLTNDDEVFNGGDGDDNVNAEGGSDIVYGGAGNDDLDGFDQDDYIYGGVGNDALDGGWGNDIIDAGIGDDTIQGGPNIDEIHPGFGNDIIVGGDDADKFFFDTPLSIFNVDHIYDFDHCQYDEFALSVAIFPKIGLYLSIDEFARVRSVDDANDYIIYNKPRGRLYYDEDGNGPEDRSLFAILDNSPRLNHNDFIMVA